MRPRQVHAHSSRLLRGIAALALLCGGAEAQLHPRGGELQVNQSTLVEVYPAVAAASDGDFTVVWVSESGYFLLRRSLRSPLRRAGPRFTIRCGPPSLWRRTGTSSWRGRATASSARAAPDFRINSQTTAPNQDPTIAALPNGDFVVAWSGKAETGYYHPIFARRFDATGIPQAIELQVSGATETSESLPAVAARGDGGFVVVWEIPTDDASTTILARRFDASDVAQGDAFPVGSDTSHLARAAIAMDAAGSFVVAWENDYETPGSAIFARHFAPDASAIGSEFQVNVFTTAIDRSPSVATDGSGHFVIAWHRGVLDPVAQEITNYRILVRRFADSPATLDVDGDGSVEALTDAILVLRFAFGFRGAVLIASAVGASCTRCDAGAIEAFLAPLFQ